MRLNQDDIVQNALACEVLLVTMTIDELKSIPCAFCEKFARCRKHPSLPFSCLPFPFEGCLPLQLSFSQNGNGINDMGILLGMWPSAMAAIEAVKPEPRVLRAELTQVKVVQQLRPVGRIGLKRRREFSTRHYVSRAGARLSPVSLDVARVTGVSQTPSIVYTVILGA